MNFEKLHKIGSETDFIPTKKFNEIYAIPYIKQLQTKYGARLTVDIQN